MVKIAESVTLAHPDKVCDQISDAILDECLRQDHLSRVAVETLGGHGVITVTGELTTNAFVNINDLVKKVYADVGYNDNIGVQVNIVSQSREIKDGVDSGGAGDQGIMVGYATRETPELMPLEVMLARRLTRLMGTSDGKSQVVLEDGRVRNILCSLCGVEGEGDYPNLLRFEIQNIVGEYGDKETAILLNPNGPWFLGGFAADTGLTGRKLMVDNYGPRVPVGGGCFSGKDATKVDRSAAYMARKVAVDYLKKFEAREVYVYLAYAIGRAEPLAATAIIDGREVKVDGYDLTPGGIIDFLDLRKPQFRETAEFGHFGNNFKWDL